MICSKYYQSSSVFPAMQISNFVKQSKAKILFMTMATKAYKQKYYKQQKHIEYEMK